MDRRPITELLAEARHGKRDALDRLLPLVYDELRRLAHHRLRFERPDHTLNTTALVHEAYLKLVDQERVDWANRSHFFAIAAQAMRRLLVNYAEMRAAVKRGGGAVHLPLEDAPIAVSDAEAARYLALDEALRRLERFNERGCRVVEYRFFAGLSYEEIGEVMGTSPITVRRAWAAAKSWLRRELGPELVTGPSAHPSPPENPTPA